jgi:hypothetical protein
MANNFVQKIFLLFCTVCIAGCTVQTPIPLAATKSTPLPTTTPLPSITPIPTSTPLPATRLDIGIEGISIQPNVLTYLLNDHPSYSDSLFQTVIHPGLYKLNPDNHSLIPVIASSPEGEWIKTNGVLEQTIEIKPGIKWSDGSFITTDDILYSYNLLKEIASLHLGTNREILLASSIEIDSPSHIKMIVKNDYLSTYLNQSILTFPILQKKYWEKYTIQLFENQYIEQINSVSAEIDLINADRILQEQDLNTLLQQLNDTRIQSNNKKSKAGELKLFINSRRAPQNLNGMKDSENLIRSNNEVSILLGEISILQGILDNQVSQFDGIRSQVAASVLHQQDLEEKMSGLVDEISNLLSEVDLKEEPLVIPFRINVSSPNFVEIQAVTDQVSSPNNIAFQAMSSDDLASNFEQGNLDTIFSFTNTDLSADKNPHGVAQVSAVILNPISDKLTNPVLTQAITCIFTSPDLWEGRSLYGSDSLQAYEEAPGPQLDLPGCSGPYKTRLLNMRMILDKNLFTWNYLRNGSIVPGSMKDPLGQVISPLTLTFDQDIQLPADVQEKFSLSLKKLGIDIIINQLPESVKPNFDQTIDLIITNWQTSLPIADQLCSLPVYPGYSRFPIHMQSTLFKFCDVPVSIESSISQSTPSPKVLLSGKETSSSYLPQSYVVLLDRDELFNYSNSESITKYDLTWLLPMVPSWLTSW